jgi:lipid A 3-O-deacylase
MKQFYRILILSLVLCSSCLEQIPDRRTHRDTPPEIFPKSRGLSPASAPKVVVSSGTEPSGFLAPSAPALTSSPVTVPPSASARSDSSFSRSIPKLERLHAEPDLSEPLTRRTLFDEEGAEQGVITLGQERYLVLQGDNDILDNTDRFYTNGLRFELILPAFSASPLSRILVPYWSSGVNYYGLSVVQNMYTPSTTKVGGILEGDRPYAAYLYLGSFKITNDQKRMVRLRSEIQLGVIGPASLGEMVQKSFHNSVPTNNEPLGWEFQVRNDLLLNYVVSVEKGLLTAGHAEVHLFGTGSLGTAYTGLAAGVYLRTGLFNPYFSNLGVSRRQVNVRNGWKNNQFYCFMRLTGAGIGYDATLEGGMINHSSPYVIRSSQMARAQFRGSAGLAFSHSGFQVSLEQYLQSPEFIHGWWHKWMSLNLTFAL